MIRLCGNLLFGSRLLTSWIFTLKILTGEAGDIARCYNACLVCLRLWVQSMLPEEKERRKNSKQWDWEWDLPYKFTNLTHKGFPFMTHFHPIDPSSHTITLRVMISPHALWEEANIWPIEEKFISLFRYVLWPNLTLKFLLFVLVEGSNTDISKSFYLIRNHFLKGALYCCFAWRASFSDGRSHGLYISWYKYSINMSYRLTITLYFFECVCVWVWNWAYHWEGND